MNFRILFATILAILMLSMPLSASAAEDSLTPLQIEEVESIIEEYLVDNPEILIRAMNAYRAKQKRADMERQARILAHMDKELRHNPNSPVAGNPQGDITIVEFFDYRCGYCRRMFEPVMELVESDGEIRFVLKEFPILGPESVFAARAALAKLEHLVVQDIFLTETACYADVILPASAWPEKDGTVTNSNRQVQIGRQALQPPGDARQDLWIIEQIARGMGLAWDHGGAREGFREMREAMNSIHGMSWQRLLDEDAITYPCLHDGDPGEAVIFGEQFPTDDGRGKFVPCDIVHPDELPDENYPMVLLTGRLLEHWHTGAMTRRAPVLDQLEPEAVAHLAPADLDRLGLAAGDRIHVASRRGEIELTARLDVGVQPGTLFIPFCFAEAAANLLTNAALDPDGKIAEVKYCAVQITTP